MSRDARSSTLALSSPGSPARTTHQPAPCVVSATYRRSLLLFAIACCLLCILTHPHRCEDTHTHASPDHAGWFAAYICRYDTTQRSRSSNRAIWSRDTFSGYSQHTISATWFSPSGANVPVISQRTPYGYNWSLSWSFTVTSNNTMSTAVASSVRDAP